MDGVDAVLVDLSRGFEARAEHFVSYPAALKATLLALNTPGANELHTSALAANEVARLYAHWEELEGLRLAAEGPGV